MAIVGVSFDTPAKNLEWAAEEGFSFELWTDDDKTLALYYGAATSQTQQTASRISKLLNSDGTLLLDYFSVGVTNHPQEVLEDCQALFGDGG